MSSCVNKEVNSIWMTIINVILSPYVWILNLASDTIYIHKYCVQVTQTDVLPTNLPHKAQNFTTIVKQHFFSSTSPKNILQLTCKQDTSMTLSHSWAVDMTLNQNTEYVYSRDPSPVMLFVWMWLDTWAIPWSPSVPPHLPHSENPRLMLPHCWNFS